MTVLSSNPSSVVSAGAWTGAANAYTSNNVFATNTGATQNTEYPMDLGGFDFSSIPEGSTINSVTVTIEAKTGTSNRAQIKGELLDNTTSLGIRALANLTNADVAYTWNPTATLAQLKSANLKVRVTNKRIVSQASTTSVDWVKIDVDYTEPVTHQASGNVAIVSTVSGTATGGTEPPLTPMIDIGFNEGSGTVLNDLSGHDKDFTLSSTTGWTTGYRDGGFDFTSGLNADRFASIGPAPVTYWTIMAWVKHSGIGSGDVIQDASSGDLQLAVFSDGTWATGAGATAADSALPSNEWHHIAVVCDGGGVRYYLDGVLDGESQTPFDLFLDNTVWYIGNGIVGAFSGVLDEVKVFDTDLFQEEIVDWMNTPSGELPSSGPTNHVAAGVVPISSVVTGAVTARHAVAGVVPITSVITGNPVRRVPAAGTIPIVSTVTGNATVVSGSVTHQAAGTVPIVSTVTGAVTARHAASGVVPISIVVTGNATLPAGPTGAMPIAEYGFNEGSGTVAHDSSWHQRPLTPKNGVEPVWVAGHTASGVTVPAIGDAFWSFAYDPPHRIPLGAWTMMSWTSGGGISAMLCYGTEIGPGNGAYSYAQVIRSNLGANTANMQVFGHDAWNDGEVSSPGGFAHLAVTWDGVDTLKLYANGTLIEEVSSGLTLPPTYADGITRIGVYAGSGIDDLRFFDVALTQSEIVTWMNTPVVEPPACGWPSQWTDAWCGGVDHDASGTVSIVSTVTGDARISKFAAGNVPIVSAVTGAVTSRHVGAGVIPITSAVTGNPRSGLRAAGVIPIVSTVAGAPTVRAVASGTVPIVSAVSGAVTANLKASGVVPIVSALTGDATRIINSVTHQAAGTVPITSTVAGSVTANFAAAGVVPISSALTGAVTSRHSVAGSVAIVSASSGSASGVMVAAGVVPITSAVTGTVTANLKASGTVPIVSTVAGTLAPHQASGTVAIISSVSGSASRFTQASGVVPILSTVAGSVTARYPVSGVVPISSVVAGNAIRVAQASGAVQIFSDSAGSVTARHAASGVIPIVSAVTGNPTPPGSSSATVVITSVVTGSVTARLQVAGTVPIVSDVAGAVTSVHQASGTIPIVSTVAGSVTSQHRLTGIVPISSVVAGSITANLAVSGTVPIISTVNGTLAGTSAEGVIPIVSTVTGTVTARLAVGGTVAITSTVTGNATRVTPASGTVPILSAVAGTVRAGRQASGTVPIVSSLTGTITARYQVSGQVQIVSSVSGTLYEFFRWPEEVSLTITGPRRTLDVAGPERSLVVSAPKRSLGIEGPAVTLSVSAPRLVLED